MLVGNARSAPGRVAAVLGRLLAVAVGYAEAEQALTLAREAGDDGVAARALADLSFIETVLDGGKLSSRFDDALMSAENAQTFAPATGLPEGSSTRPSTRAAGHSVMRVATCAPSATTETSS